MAVNIVRVCWLAGNLFYCLLLVICSHNSAI